MRDRRPIVERDIATPLTAFEGPTTNMPLPLRQTHAFVEETSECDDHSSTESTPLDYKRHSFSEELTTAEDVVAYAAGIPLPNDVYPALHNRSVGPVVNTFVVPKNFGAVAKDMYRCAFPQPENFSFLRCLRLKTILTLVGDGCTNEHQHFIHSNRIQHRHVHIKAHKNSGDQIDEEMMVLALKEIMNPGNYPLLVHCNRGKHRTGCVVATFRKMVGWELNDIIAEYRKFAGLKARNLDIEYIEQVDVRNLYNQLALFPSLETPVAEPHMDSVVSGQRVGSTRLRG